MRQPGRFKKCR